MTTNKTLDEQDEETRQRQLRLAEAQLEAAAAHESKIRQNLVDAEEMTRIAIDGARDLGISWRDIAAISGMTDTQIQWRAHRDDPSVKEGAARKIIPPEQHRKRSAVRPGKGPGISVTDYARKEGITRRTVYVWIESGKLQSTRNELGQIRVLGDGNTTF